MAHWGWYWKIKLKHKAKALCSQFDSIDSFAMFENKLGVEIWMNQVAYEIPRYKLKAILNEDHYFVTFAMASGFSISYKIPIEKQACNFGGFRYFFHCPWCDKRMRMLYLKDGVFICRQCLNLGYYTQRLRPSGRIVEICTKIKKFLENRGGSLNKKPCWMKKRTFKKLRDKHFECWEVKQLEAINKEWIQDFPHKAHMIQKWI